MEEEEQEKEEQEEKEREEEEEQQEEQEEEEQEGQWSQLFVLSKPGQLTSPRCHGAGTPQVHRLVPVIAVAACVVATAGGPLPGRSSLGRSA